MSIFIPFENSSSFAVVGSTKSGKTTFMARFLRRLPFMFRTVPKQVVYYYQKHKGKLFDDLEKHHNVVFRKGVPTEDEIEALSESDVPSLIVLDDCMLNVARDKHLLRIFTTLTNNGALSVFFLTQNLNFLGRNTRTIALNTHYIILLDSPRNYGIFKSIAAQTQFSEKFLRRVYKDSMKGKYNTLVIDLHTGTNDKNRIRTNFEHLPHVYREIKPNEQRRRKVGPAVSAVTNG